MVRWILLISLLAGPAMAQTCPPDRLPPLDACAGPRVRIALVGDVLIHEALARRGYAQGFDSVWTIGAIGSNHVQQTV